MTIPLDEPSLALQAAIVATLKADGALALLIGERVYDRVPPPVALATAPTFPYVTVGDDQVSGAHAECLEGSTEVFATLHAWSRAVGKGEAKRIAGAVVRALNYADLTLENYRLVLIEHDSTRHLDDPDGLTSHSVVTFHALIDEE